MKINIPIFSISALVFLCGLQAAQAQELTQTFITPEGFSIKLPADWKRIDSQTLNGSTKELRKDMPNAKLQNPSDGFEPKAVDLGIGHPGIIVIPNKISNGNRNISEQEFKQYAAFLKQQAQQSANSAFDKNSLNAQAHIDDVSYDEQKHSLRVVSIMSVPNFGRVRSIDIIFLTESGMLTFKFNSAEKEYSQYADLFSAIINSIGISKNTTGDSSGKNTKKQTENGTNALSGVSGAKTP
jgi:hypothetical protein